MSTHTGEDRRDRQATTSRSTKSFRIDNATASEPSSRLIHVGPIRKWRCKETLLEPIVLSRYDLVRN